MGGRVGQAMFVVRMWKQMPPNLNWISPFACTAWPGQTVTGLASQCPLAGSQKVAELAEKLFTWCGKERICRAGGFLNMEPDRRSIEKENGLPAPPPRP